MTWRFKVGEVALVAGDAKIRADTPLMPGDEVTVVALIDRMDQRTQPQGFWDRLRGVPPVVTYTHLRYRVADAAGELYECTEGALLKRRPPNAPDADQMPEEPGLTRLKADLAVFAKSAARLVRSRGDA